MPSTDATLKLAVDLRLACQLVSRKVRFEGSHEVAPHQFSVLVKLVDGPRGPAELADLEQVSKPSMSRTIGGWSRRASSAATGTPATDGPSSSA